MATTQTVRMFAPVGLGGAIQTQYSGTVYVAADSTVTVNAADVPNLIQIGFEFAQSNHWNYATLGAPVAASSAVIATSTSLTVGSLTIAAQPDVPRQLQAVIFNGTAALTAGVLTLTYNANDGTSAQVDALSLVAASQSVNNTAALTVTTTKGVEHLTSAIVSNLTGGVTPGIILGTNNYLALPVQPGFVDWAVTKETKLVPTAGTLGVTVPTDETASTTVISSGALISPTTAPNGTNSFAFNYNFISRG